ncbi:hypothetical protein E4T56_gene20486 [Termitomyces sp. T112]|nr:hypothetical protein E4T56_gene20486 [Termitomyces sp. T112]
MEFARHACTLLVNLGYPNTPTTLEGDLSETTQGTLGIDAKLQNELYALVKEIHTSPNPHPFKDPLNPFHSFHVQCKEPIGTQSKTLPPIPCQQEELNTASSILRNLNSAGGLFDQPAIHTLALFIHPQANSILSAFHTWDQSTAPKPHAQWPLPHIDDNNQTLSYIDKPGNPTNEAASCNGPPQNRPPHFDLCAPHINAFLPH